MMIRWILSSLLWSVLWALEDQDSDAVFVVKIGGSSITNKAVKESVQEDVMDWFAQTVSSSISRSFLSATKLADGRYVSSEGECSSTNDMDTIPLNKGKTRPAFVIVHGAGSFGHHTAKEFGLTSKTMPPGTHEGGNRTGPIIRSKTLEQRYTMRGLAETRLSVETLNRLVVGALLKHGVNAVGISPCFAIANLQAHGGGETPVSTDQAWKSLRRVVQDTLQAGLVPILHGDACLYGADSGGILSGDALMEIIAKQPGVTRAIFITDQDGIFSSDPRRDPKAQLLRYVQVDKDSLGIISPKLDASGSSHDHDVTGGFKTKVGSAAAIAANGVNVTIVKYNSLGAEHAMRGDQTIERSTVVFSN